MTEFRIDLKYFVEDEVWVISNNKPKKMKIKEVMIITNNKSSRVLYSFYSDSRTSTAFIEENSVFDIEELAQEAINKSQNLK